MPGSSPIPLTGTYQANVTQFVQNHLGPQVNVLEAVQNPRLFLTRIARVDETPMQALFRFHETTVADLDFGMIPAPVWQAAMQGYFAESVESRIDAFFAAVLETLKGEAEPSRRDQLRQEVFQKFLEYFSKISEVYIEDRKQLTLYSTSMPGVMSLPTTIQEVHLGHLNANYGVDSTMFLEMTAEMERCYRVGIPEEASNGTIGEYIDVIVEQLTKTGR